MPFNRLNVLFGKDRDDYIKELLYRRILCPYEQCGLRLVQLSNSKSLDFYPREGIY